jgi:hypothetical protein
MRNYLQRAAQRHAHLRDELQLPVHGALHSLWLGLRRSEDRPEQLRRLRHGLPQCHERNGDLRREHLWDGVCHRVQSLLGSVRQHARGRFELRDLRQSVQGQARVHVRALSLS